MTKEINHNERKGYIQNGFGFGRLTAKLVLSECEGTGATQSTQKGIGFVGATPSGCPSDADVISDGNSQGKICVSVKIFNYSNNKDPKGSDIQNSVLRVLRG